MTANNNHLLVHNSVCWQFGQGSATRFFCCSLMCQKSSGSLVESSDQSCLPHVPGGLVWLSARLVSMCSLILREASLGFLSHGSKRVSVEVKRTLQP